jgi:hypothetical protein
MQFIEFNDLAGGAFDLGYFFRKGFYPLVDRDMTEPQDPANRPKAQAFQIQGYRHAALGWGGGIRFVWDRIQILALLTLVSLSAFDGNTFHWGSIGTSRTTQHRHLP